MLRPLRVHSALFWALAFAVVLSSAMVGCEPTESPGVSPPQAGFADAAPSPDVRSLLAAARSNPVLSSAVGYRLVVGQRPDRGRSVTSLGRALEARLPGSADGTIELSVEHGPTVALSRLAAEPAKAQLEDGVLVYRGAAPQLDAMVFADGHRVEDLLVAHGPEAQLGYRFALPARWRLAKVLPTVVELRDQAGRAVLRVEAPRGWSASGAELAVELSVRGGDEVAVAFDAPDAWPATIDPAFVSASTPLKLRSQHSATLLSDGRVLFVGGQTGASIDGTAEIYDPVFGTSTAVGSMAQVRRRHSASLLPDGRVLIAGGRELTNFSGGELDSTEIFDPDTGTFSAGPTLSTARGSHTATRLPDNRVLIAGAADMSAEIFDSSNDTFSATDSFKSINSGVAALLTSGKVLFVSGSNAELFDPAGNSGVGTFTVTGGPTTLDAGETLTALRNGGAIVSGGCPCASVGGKIFSEYTTELFDPAANAGVGAFAVTGNAVEDRLGSSANLLPSGEVFLCGSNDKAVPNQQRSGEVYNVGTGLWSAVADAMPAAHGDHTTTLLPSGDILVFGGEQAAADLYVDGGTAGFGTFTPTANNLTAGRYGHSATLLTNGEVLVAGGSSPLGLPPPGTDQAELYDPVTDMFSTTGVLSTTRLYHTATLLLDGRVLVAGGDGVGTAEIFDRSANSGAGDFVLTTGAMTSARHEHAATRLPDGRVLISGGDDGTNILDTAEIYDPATDTFAATSNTMSAARSKHAAAMLPDGKVLVVGGSTADLYDPVTDTFSATTPPGAAYRGTRISVLPDGKAFVTGSFTLAAELYDPATATWSFTGPDTVARTTHTQSLLPGGKVLLTGGLGDGAEPSTYNGAQMYDPLAKAFYTVPQMADTRTAHTATVLLSGDVLVVGGLACTVICIGVNDTAERWRRSIGDPSWPPSLTSAPAVVQPGEQVAITGTNFLGLESGSGRYNNSPSNHPVALWQPLHTPAELRGKVTGWTSASATWHVPTTALYGKGLLRVVVNGMPSNAVPVEISQAAAAIGCTYDAECASGFCADGVCCDSACDDVCQACTAAIKGSGADGVCEPVPAEQDPNDDCFLTQGGPCSADGECQTGLVCADGVCCDAACPGQCEACDVVGSVGTCVPVVGTPHGARPVCDDPLPTDLCEATSCDGVDRTSCAATVGPCGTFACTATGCLTSCDTDADCATGHHCDGGECVAGVCNGTIAVTADGTEVDCSPFKCRSDGSCRSTCGTVDDCAEPFACNFDGRCVPRPPNDELTSGCGCVAAGKKAPRHHAWLLALSALVLIGARRRRRVAAPAMAAIAVLLIGVGSVHAQSPGAPTPPPPPAAPAPPVVQPPAEAPAQPPADAPPGDEAPKDEPAGDATPSPEPEPEAPPAAADAAPEPGAGADMSPAERKTEAQRRFRKGIGLIEQKAWSAALAEFIASRGLYATSVATANAAFCYRKLNRFDESLTTYETLLREFPNLKDAAKAEAKAALTELRGLVGFIQIDEAEPGATIMIDGRNRGTYPPAAPLRASAGAHIVRVHLEGYEPFESRVDLPGGGTARVQAKMAKLTASGVLKVAEKSGKKLEVLVDNVVVGETPWEGRLSPGNHMVRLQGADRLGTQPAAAPIEAGQTTSLNLEAVVLDASLRIEPVPASATIALDSVEVGRGVWEGPLRAGEHKLELAAEGFLAVSRTISLQADENGVIKVELERDEDSDMWRVPGKFTFDVAIAGGLVPSFGGDVVAGCSGDCSQGVGLGGMAKFNAGYEVGDTGIGFGVSAGVLSATQEVDGRAGDVQPVGLTPRPGEVSDELRLRGFMFGAFGSLRFFEDYPLMVRLGVGPMFASLRDQRVGTFALADGNSYLAGPVTQDPGATYLVFDPEVRIGVPIGRHVELSAGLSALVMVALNRPEWDSSREIDASVDGIGAFGGAELTGPVMLVLAPGAGARAHF